MNILILGAGNIGKTIAHELMDDYEVTVGDISEERLNDMPEGTETTELDASDLDPLSKRMEEFETIVSALPGRYGFGALKAALEAQRDIVDVSFMPEDPLPLDDEFRRAGISAVVDAGFGPGMSNVFVGNIDEKLDSIRKIDIKIGGLPKEADPPLFYSSTWSTEDLMQEYIRPARMIRDGQIVELEPLEDIGKVELMGEQFEEFYSDGLRTLLETIDVEDMEETTLRWKGHLEKMRMLKDLDFLDDDNLGYTRSVLEPHMDYESEDFSIMVVIAEGKKVDDDIEIRYQLYDEAGEKFSSMARVTGFTTALTARYMIEDEIQPGIVPPEELGRDDAFHDHAISGLREKGIDIQSDSTILNAGD